MMFFRLLALSVFSCFPLFANLAFASQTSCFAFAETYYEQVYCEIRQKSPETVLPAFLDFKNNDARMQAMLLKRKAEALGIPLKIPASTSGKKTAAKSIKNTIELYHGER